MKVTLQVRTKIFRSAGCLAAALLFLSLAAPAPGQNYSLSSPKLWSPEEKRAFDQEAQPARTKQTPIQTSKVPVKKVTVNQVPVKKLKVQKKVQLVTVPQKKIQPQQLKPLKEQIMVHDGVLYREVTVQEGDSLARISRRYRNNDPTSADILLFNAMESSVIHSGDIIKLPVTVKPLKPPQLVQELEQLSAPSTPSRLATPRPPAGTLQQRTAGSQKKPEAAKGVQLAAKEIAKEGAKALPQPAYVSVSPVPAKSGLQQTLASPGITTARHGEKPPAETRLPNPAPQESPVCTAEKQPAGLVTPSSGQQLFQLAVKSYRQGDCVTAVQLFARFLVENTDSLFAPDASLFNADCYLKLSGR
jgi:TolA-binding protein